MLFSFNFVLAVLPNNRDAIDHKIDGKYFSSDCFWFVPQKPRHLILNHVLLLNVIYQLNISTMEHVWCETFVGPYLPYLLKRNIFRVPIKMIR